MSLASIWETVKKDVVDFFAKEQPIVDEAFEKAKNIVNILKAISGSGASQAVIAIFEAFLPAAYVEIAKKALADLFVVYNWAIAEEGKSLADIIADGFAKIGELSGNARVLALTNVATIIGHTISNLSGGNSTIQHAIVKIPTIYDNSVLSTPTPSAAPGSELAGAQKQ